MTGRHDRGTRPPRPGHRAAAAETARKQALAFIAAYDRPDADAYEQRVAAIATQWLRLQRGRLGRQGVASRLVEELHRPDDAPGGAGWEDLRRKFTAWAIDADLIAPDDPRLTPQGP
jgi:hypothetical protein